MTEIIECVPNFSEGRDHNVILAIAAAIENVGGTKILDVNSGASVNRTVITFIGNRESILNAAFAGIAKAAELIDMRRHQGAHPRLGATDVCPLVPISGISVEECIALSHQLAKRVAEELHIPVYLYAKSAQKPERVDLVNIRAGEYEGLEQKLRDPNWQPDYGQPTFNPKSGATVIGVRDFLIAFNVNIDTRDCQLAKDIALTIREKGRVKRDQNGNKVYNSQGEPIYESGLLKNVRAIGWYIDEYKMAQVSTNLTNYKITPPHVVFEEIQRLANARGRRVTGSELVGLIPEEALLIAGRYYLKKQGDSENAPEGDLIQLAVQAMGLNAIAPFDPAKKIIEYRLAELEKPLAG
ncbi:MAG TPA: glutamate formimidoyltransferase [Candidatus Marinimicrobia bacterium]|nr:glutamate formimidoyltransferase [Candidatus Neomarinimicrobiota bacterium]HRS52601.1 glutamate formimidoyltransferase [Candidatus Neomarinimicrobiota bacterium]HRU92603.1 glutamate formimidoyltransferase [Candidatus Neomarinimicrobiota bacterium]